MVVCGSGQEKICIELFNTFFSLFYDAKVNNAVSSLGEIYNVVGAHRGSINHK